MLTPAAHYRLAAALAVLTVALLAFGVTALGIIGDGGRDDRGYLAVPVVLLVGAVLARLRAGGMALALAATAVTQLAVTAVALLLGVPDGTSVADVLIVNALYAALFGASAWLFRRAAGHGSTARAGVRSPA